LRPEFINRLDDLIVFHQLGSSQIRAIVKIQLDGLIRRLADRRIELKLTDAALDHLALTGFDPVYGARPLKRAVQREVLNPLATALLRGEIKDGQTVTVDQQNGSLTFEAS